MYVHRNWIVMRISATQSDRGRKKMIVIREEHNQTLSRNFKPISSVGKSLLLSNGIEILPETDKRSCKNARYMMIFDLPSRKYSIGAQKNSSRRKTEKATGVMLLI